jgi:hypothetical protein
METHSKIFVAIGNFVSAPSFPFAGEVRGRTWPAPTERKHLPTKAVTAAATLWKAKLAPRVFRLEVLPQRPPSGASPFLGRFRGHKRPHALPHLTN